MNAEERAKSALAEYRVYASKVNSEAFEDVVSLSIQEAVEAEREACAVAASDHECLQERHDCTSMREDIAKAIRARGEGEG